MIEAIMTTNSGNPIGRWLDETQEELISVTQCAPCEAHDLLAKLCCTTLVPGWLLRGQTPSNPKTGIDDDTRNLEIPGSMLRIAPE
jgi:hypothetical protein